jgi:hypothetical protein
MRQDECPATHHQAIGAVMTNWTVTLWGKHPSFKDYLSVGDLNPCVVPFVQWVQNGFSTMSLRALRQDDATMWLFWILPNPSLYLCGLLASSKDLTNRPFPLLISGSGRTSTHDIPWEVLTHACRATWEGMKALRTDNLPSFTDLTNRLTSIPDPYLNRTKSAESIVVSSRLSAYRVILRTNMNRSNDQDKIDLTLENGRESIWNDFFRWQHVVKQTVMKKPLMIFFNEIKARAHIFFRPLQTADYIRMHSLG